MTIGYKSFAKYNHNYLETTKGKRFPFGKWVTYNNINSNICKDDDFRYYISLDEYHPSITLTGRQDDFIAEIEVKESVHHHDNHVAMQIKVIKLIDGTHDAPTATYRFSSGKFHSLLKPSIEYHLSKINFWLNNGYLHRTYGPAIDGPNNYAAFYINGQRDDSKSVSQTMTRISKLSEGETHKDSQTGKTTCGFYYMFALTKIYLFADNLEDAKKLFNDILNNPLCINCPSYYNSTFIVRFLKYFSINIEYENNMYTISSPYIKNANGKNVGGMEITILIYEMNDFINELKESGFCNLG